MVNVFALPVPVDLLPIVHFLPMVYPLIVKVHPVHLLALVVIQLVDHLVLAVLAHVDQHLDVMLHPIVLQYFVNLDNVNLLANLVIESMLLELVVNV